MEQMLEAAIQPSTETKRKYHRHKKREIKKLRTFLKKNHRKPYYSDKWAAVEMQELFGITFSSGSIAAQRDTLGFVGRRGCNWKQAHSKRRITRKLPTPVVGYPTKLEMLRKAALTVADLLYQLTK